MIAALLFVSVALVRAWISPSSQPPQVNVPKPFTIGSAPETKAGTMQSNLPFPLSHEGAIAVNDIFIRAAGSAGKWASELLNELRPTQDLDVEIRVVTERAIVRVGTLPSGLAYGKIVTGGQDCRQGYQLLGCSGSREKDMRQVPGCNNTQCRYVGTLPYPNNAANNPNVTPLGCATEVAVTWNQNVGPPSLGSNDASVSYAYCVKTKFLDE